ncbi:MAG: hypothetical protein ABI707_08270 [Ferruginibacter sp.]
MIIEIPKNTTEKKQSAFSKGNELKKTALAKFNSFFGKLPLIEDGLIYQKKVRNEWRQFT